MIEYIGNTPLIELKHFSDLTGCKILGKAEFMNPGGSVKDRAAKYIIQHALQHNHIKKGGTIVEGTAGNTGIGLALVGNYFGLKTTIVIPETQTEEKKATIRSCGAKLIEVPAVPYKDPNNYVKYSQRVSEACDNPNGVLWANQFDNVANQEGHFADTGPEIYEQLAGDIDGFICACGTGGTLTGVAKYLKTKNNNIKIGLADPHGAALYSYFSTGKLESSGSSITEGIGQGRITKNLEGLDLDYPLRISDEDALQTMFTLVEKEGLYLGGSSGINVYAAVEMAKIMGPGHTIVTILCDSGSRYLSKLYNRNFLENNNLPCPEWL